MKHYGDITKLNGYELPVVDVITGGSPCQDLSVAGKRAGLDGERSGLFMEQIRIVKELRERDRRENHRSGQYVRPRYMVWENVPGAFSSGSPRGADFQAVLTEIVRIAEPEAPDVPLPEKGWPYSGAIYDEMGRWSIAWRLHDAQFWGVAQRRKRIALVADFGGLAGPEILFEREGVSRHIEPSGEARKETAGGFGPGAEESSRIEEFIKAANIGAPHQQDLIQSDQGVARSLAASTHGAASHLTRTLISSKPQPQGNSAEPPKAGLNVTGFNRERCGAVTADELMPTLQAAAGNSGNNRPMVCTMAKPVVGCNIGGQAETFSQSESMYTLRAETNGAVMPIATNVFGAEVSPTLVSSLSTPVGNTQGGFNVVCMDVGWIDSAKESAPPLLARQYKDPPIAAYGFDRASCNQGANAKFGISIDEERIGAQTSGVGGVVRRLTPMECERLQGFPDNWTNIGEWTDSKGKLHKESSDAARYKALGNSIAVGYANNASGFWCWLLKRISAQYERNATLGSLFDGIGGFPLAWEHYNGKGSAIWASEIEEFCIAVTKIRFPEAEDETVHPV